MSWEWCRQINAPPDPYRDDGAAPKSGGSDTPNPRRNLGRSKACAGIRNMQHRACSMDVQISCQQINFRSGKAFTFIISSSPSLLVHLFPLSPSILLTPCSKAFFFWKTPDVPKLVDVFIWSLILGREKNGVDCPSRLNGGSLVSFAVQFFLITEKNGDFNRFIKDQEWLFTCLGAWGYSIGERLCGWGVMCLWYNNLAYISG